MKRIIRTCLLVVLNCLFMSMTAFANEDINWAQIASRMNIEDTSVLLPEGVNQSISYDNVARGEFLSSCTIGITNNGYGAIGIYGNVFAHKPVKKIRLNIYLDRWDENEEEWFQVDLYRFVYEYEEGGEDLVDATESFSVLGFPTGCYYRLRAACTVWPFEGGFESRGPMTDGVLIKDGPA
ncbi:MAG: hypothetical protein Q4C66_03175 [Lachnospiraceae bacterium]|nr:hypothetical protein [Lachnospiraceae bacterium]